MVHHLLGVYDDVLQRISLLLWPVTLLVLVSLGAAAVLALILYRMDREALPRLASRLRPTLISGAAWSGLLVLALVETQVLSAVHYGLGERLEHESIARYSAVDDPGGGPTVQQAPSVAYLDTATKEQRIILPQNLPNTLNALPGWNPEDMRYDTRPILSVEDELEKDGKTVVIKRKTTIHRYIPLKLGSSDLKVRLAFSSPPRSGNRQFYQADFAGRYSFANPFKQTKHLHFLFPLPSNSGTLSNFRFRVDGKDQLSDDLDSGYEWEGDLAPSQVVAIDVGYSNRGGGSWTYDLSGRRAPISEFRLQVAANSNNVKFARGSLFPTNRHSGLSSEELAWDLQNQITSQNVSLFFSGVSLTELTERLYVFAPLALLGFVGMVWLWSRTRRVAMPPAALAFALVAYGAGFVLTAWWMSYMPLWAAVGMAFALTTAIAVAALGRRLALPAAVAALIPLTFLAVGNTGLYLSVLCLAMLALTVLKPHPAQVA